MRSLRMVASRCRRGITSARIWFWRIGLRLLHRCLSSFREVVVLHQEGPTPAVLCLSSYQKDPPSSCRFHLTDQEQASSLPTSGTGQQPLPDAPFTKASNHILYHYLAVSYQGI